MKTISINWNCLKSIKQAEKLKTKYENLGYTLYSKTTAIHINEFLQQNGVSKLNKKQMEEQPLIQL